MKINQYAYKKLPLIRQEQRVDCGHACVAMIGNYHGHDIDLASLRQITPPAITGSTLLDLASLCEKVHLNTRAIRVALDELQYVQCPAILHWNLNHFVVLKAVKAHEVVIHDPAVGVRTISHQEVSLAFTGVVLEVEKKASFSIIRSPKQLKMWDLFKHIGGLKKSMFFLLSFSLLIELCILVNPLLIQYITDAVANSNSIDNLFVVVVGFLLLTLCHSLMDYVRSHFVVYLTRRMTEYFSTGVMRHVLKIPYAYFEQQHRGDILSRFYAIQEIQHKMTTDSTTTLLDGFVLILALLMMFVYSIKLSLIVLTTLSFYLLIRLLAYRHHKKNMELSIEGHAQVHTKFLEIVQSMMAIKLYGKEEAMYQSWYHHFIPALNADMCIARANIVYSSANTLLFNMEHIVVMALGALSVLDHQCSIGMLMAFLAYRQSVVNKASSCIQKVCDYKLLSVHLARVSDLLTQATEDPSLDHKKKLIQIEGSFTVKRLSYRYAEHQPWIVKNLSFTVQAGEKIALVGPSGVGKTTLLKIMLGLIAPTEGELCIDALPLSSIGVHEYRSVCAGVMQNDALVSGSLLDNISFMDEVVDVVRVIDVAKMACIHDDIMNMPMGYETLVGDLGSSLSGGQRQRILIARALYKKPKILFLDEATSHLDTQTESKINAMLKKLKITQIIIAHREASIEMADRVIHLASNV